VVLAPMEGVTDAPMRALVSEQGGLSFCVTEFLRVTGQVYPPKVFRRYAPEWKNEWKTESGCPVQLQILGGEPDLMAETASRAVELGAPAIDINFGCPAPTVNRHDGGAVLLKYPCRIFEIVKAVRDRVPSHIPVSAKIRLGWEDIDDVFHNANQVQAAGATWLTIHARTRLQGYARPVYWERIGEVRRNLAIPVVANGDIWTFEDFLRCREVTGCEHFMVGRGAVADPVLPLAILSELTGKSLGFTPELKLGGVERLVWAVRVRRMVEWMHVYGYEPYRMPSRLKQWIKIASLPREIPWFNSIKQVDSVEDLIYRLENDDEAGRTQSGA
jgi:tRNA-dihydrouridine synthase C